MRLIFFWLLLLAYPTSSLYSCEDVQGPSGVYQIQVSRQTHEIYCDMETDGGGWASVIKRSDGSVSFARSFSEYSLKGVGSSSKTTQYVLSLSTIHELTNQSDHELLIEIGFSGEKVFAQYGHFEVGDSLSGYALTLKEYDEASTAGDAMSSQSGYRFCTPDKDADYDLQVNCGDLYGPGWYRDCEGTNPFGIYNSFEFNKGVNWPPWTGYYIPLSQIEFKIRKKRCKSGFGSTCEECLDGYSLCIDSTSGRKYCSDSPTCRSCQNGWYLDPKTGHCLQQCPVNEGRFIDSYLCGYCHSQCLAPNGPNKCTDAEPDSCLFQTCLEFITSFPSHMNYTFILPLEQQNGVELVMCEAQGWTSMLRRVGSISREHYNLGQLEHGLNQFPNNVMLDLNHLHYLTSNHRTELKIQIFTHDGKMYFDCYSNFSIGGKPQGFAIYGGRKLNSSDELAQFDLVTTLLDSPFIAKNNQMNGQPNCADKKGGPSWYNQHCQGFQALGDQSQLFYGPIYNISSISFSLRQNHCIEWDPTLTVCFACEIGYILQPESATCIECRALIYCEQARLCKNPMVFLERKQHSFSCSLDLDCTLSNYPDAECPEQIEETPPTGASQAKAIEKIGQAVQILTLSALASTIVSTVSIEMRVENIWGLLNQMQLIELFGLLDIRSLPQNYQQFLEYLDFAHGDFQFLSLLPNFVRYILPLDYVTLEHEQSAFNQRFAEKGIDKTSLYLNYETRIVGMLYYCIFTLFAYIFSFIFRKNPKAQKIFKKVYLNSICHRVLVEVYVELALLSFLGFFGVGFTYNQVSFSNSGSMFDFLLTLSVSSGSLAYPLCLFLCITHH